MNVYVDASSLDDTQKKLKQELADITPENYANDQKKLEQFHFTQLCEKQPIGKRMFGDFCKGCDKSFKDVYAFSQAIRNFEAGRLFNRLMYGIFLRLLERTANRQNLLHSNHL